MPLSLRRTARGTVLLLSAVGSPLVMLSAQATSGPVTRADAIRTAVTNGPRTAVARANTSVAAAALLSAGLRPDPMLSLGYSLSPPNYHGTIEIPFEFPGVRGLRIRSAEAMRQSAAYSLTFAEASAALDADTAYTRALATRELARLSRQNALDADSLRHLASVRADAGDAAALDVELATIFAGQQANAALGDSLEWMSAIIDLQGVMGLSVTNVVITPTDSLTLLTEGALNPVRPGLPVLAASSALDAANFSIQQQRRSKWSFPSLTLGLDARDPTSDTRGPYPVIGVAVPLPFFSGNRGSVAVATAERERAAAELAAVKVDYATISAQAQRRLTTARTRLDGDRLLVTSADRVATLFLTAYREGAATIANVLEAQRTVREVRSQYINDLADVVIASATVRAYPPSAAAGNP